MARGFLQLSLFGLWWASTGRAQGVRDDAPHPGPTGFLVAEVDPEDQAGEIGEEGGVEGRGEELEGTAGDESGIRAEAGAEEGL
jgi:hypothetical protein